MADVVREAVDAVARIMDAPLVHDLTSPPHLVQFTASPAAPLVQFTASLAPCLTPFAALLAV